MNYLERYNKTVYLEKKKEKKKKDWFPLGLTDLISVQSKGLSRVFSNTTIEKLQFFGAQLSL